MNLLTDSQLAVIETMSVYRTSGLMRRLVANVRELRRQLSTRHDGDSEPGALGTTSTRTDCELQPA